jgi:hypothetical protein
MREWLSVLAVLTMVLQVIYPLPDGWLVSVVFAILAVAWRRG